MSHDKIKTAARQRMAQTGEPYSAARRAVVSEQHAAGGQPPSPGAGYALAMSEEIRDWLADLRGSNPVTGHGVARALAALMTDGAGLAEPLVADTADAWRWALVQALEHSYQAMLDRLHMLRRGTAEAAKLATDIQDQLTELESAQATLRAAQRRAVAAGRPQEAAHAAAMLTAAGQRAAEARRLLPGVIEAGRRLTEQLDRLEPAADSFRVRKEVLKASHLAAQSSLLVRTTIAASDLARDDGDRQQEDGADAIGAAEARLADLTARMERELGHEARPEGLMELRPAAAGDSEVRIMFVVEPPGTALLIAVLDGPEAVADQYRDAVMASADVLRRVRAGQAPEAAACRYHDPGAFLAEFSPADAGSGGSPR